MTITDFDRSATRRLMSMKTMAAFKNQLELEYRAHNLTRGVLALTVWEINESDIGGKEVRLKYLRSYFGIVR